jgi:protein-tyrosine phosphatase
MIDLHCHILPGVDDGARNLEDALEMAQVAVKEGIERIVSTPHLFRDNSNSRDFSLIEAKRRELAQAINENGLALDVLPGAEVHISHNLLETIKENRENLMLNRSSYMFVEFPANHVFSGVKNLFFALLSETIIPIITHPERNLVFIQNPRVLYELVQMGALAQANSGSFIGLYGERTERAVHQFLELNLIHFIGSDSHGPRSLSWRLKEAVGKAEKVVGQEQARALVKENPEAAINNQELAFFLPPRDPKENERSLNVKIPKVFKGRK